VAPVHQELWNRIAAIDLQPVVSQLIEYLGWTPARVASAERFLHHTFLPADDPAQAGTLSSVWLNTLAAYELLFASPTKRRSVRLFCGVGRKHNAGTARGRAEPLSQHVQKYFVSRETGPWPLPSAQAPVSFSF
jgi:hypothetical protein